MTERRLYRRTIGLLLASLAAPALLLAPAHAANCDAGDTAALELLRKVSERATVQSFRGVVTLQRGPDMRVMQVVHGVAGDGVTDELTLLTGQDARVIRANHAASCTHPGHDMLRTAARAGEDRCGIAAHYRLRTLPGERIAGRQSTRVLVEPRDVYRYGHVFDVDADAALVLKASTVGPGGEVLERFQFASLALDADGEVEPASATVYEAQHPPRHAGPQAAAVDWSAAWLPAGFQATEASFTDANRHSYTDGMATFSIFLERLARAMQPGEGVVREGSTVSYTRGMQLAGQPVLVTVIGEIPVNTARMVADSVRPRR